ncbi:uncharacterized protein LOC131037898 isoform X1 [Cryptomeria japonica]|uniref:uncharacterized protein LOC131037898 isoform X1 n=1 Tax=Cryptomeria japonica TaxID=3369 RepID=UPI0027DA0886|nr:uncharacterized protein LOC131037898 isoform X1 [Cryptomeria japonica]
MAGAAILCNLEAIAGVVGDGRVKLNICQYTNKTSGLGANPFKFCCAFGERLQMKGKPAIKESRRNTGVCKVNMQLIFPKTEEGRKWLAQKCVFGFSAPQVLDALKALQRPAMVAILVGILLAHDPAAAMAASGGRMGGSAFSSGRGSRDYSSRTYSGPSFSYTTPYAAPSPFGFGGGLFVRPSYGIGFGAGSGLFVILMGLLAVVSVAGFLSDRGNSGLFVSSQKTSVLKLQVGLLGMARSLQEELDHIAENADTSTPEGLHLLLTETSLALLRHPDFCISGYSLADIKRNMDAGEERFNQLSIEERGKFDEETMVNVNRMLKRQPSRVWKGSDVFANEYIVVTILVAAEGEHKLPIIKSSADLKEALKKLGSIPSRQVLAVEVLWTPQNEYDTLMENELLQDYPLLRPL